MSVTHDRERGRTDDRARRTGDHTRIGTNAAKAANWNGTADETHTQEITTR